MIRQELVITPILLYGETSGFGSGSEHVLHVVMQKITRKKRDFYLPRDVRPGKYMITVDGRN